MHERTELRTYCQPQLRPLGAVSRLTLTQATGSRFDMNASGPSDCNSMLTTSSPRRQMGGTNALCNNGLPM